MELKTCPNCQKPLLASSERCAHCAPEYEWNQESYASAGCLILFVLFVFLLILMPFLMFAGMLFR